MSTATVTSGQQRAHQGVGFAQARRWTWTSAGLAVGVVTTIAGLALKDATVAGVLLELVGFVVVLLTLGAFIVVGPDGDGKG